MAYKKEDLEKLALKEITERDLVFIEDIVVYLPCSKPTFYKHKLNEVNNIKEALQLNKTNIKTSLRAKWYKSDNATLQISLMKLVCSDEERKKLSINYNDITTGGDKFQAPIININKAYEADTESESDKEAD